MAERMPGGVQAVGAEAPRRARRGLPALVRLVVAQAHLAALLTLAIPCLELG